MELSKELMGDEVSLSVVRNTAICSRIEVISYIQKTRLYVFFSKVNASSEFLGRKHDFFHRLCRVMRLFETRSLFKEEEQRVQWVKNVNRF